MNYWLLALGIIVLLIIFLYNALIRLKNQVSNAWAQIDVQLKRRFDLIPNLVKAVKGYMKHEKTVLENVTKARTSLMEAGSIHDKAEADNMLTGALKSLFAVAENYPDLKASQNFLQLQEELVGTENKIAYSRQYYNDMVMKFNIKIEKFPNNLIAKTLGFNQKELFETKGKEREPVKVDL